MSEPARLPEDVVTPELAEGSIALRVDASLYPLEAVYAAAYVFIDRCYVFLDRTGGDGQGAAIRVSLSPKRGALDEAALRDVVGEFANELLSCAWRAEIARESRTTIEAVTAQALAGARGAPTLDELEAFDFSDEAFEDPLGIAMSWEDKYAKKKDAAAGRAEAVAAPVAADAAAKTEVAPLEEVAK